jgi:hypothetical protein
MISYSLVNCSAAWRKVFSVLSSPARSFPAQRQIPIFGNLLRQDQAVFLRALAVLSAV